MPWFDQIQFWVTDHAFAIVMIFCPAVLAILLYYLAFNRYLKAVLVDRRVLLSPNNTSSTTAKPAPPINLNPQIAHVINRYLQEKKKVGLSVPPGARLIDDIGMTPDDLNAALRDLLAATHKAQRPPTSNTPIITVGDLIRYLEAAPTLTESRNSR